MTHRERMLLTFKGEYPDRLPYAPRIDLWFEANSQKNTLPSRFRDCKDSDEISRLLGWGINKVILEFQGHGDEAILDRPLGIYRVPSQGFLTHLPNDVERRVQRNGDTFQLEYITPKGVATASFVYSKEMRRSGVSIPWISEHILKSQADYAPVAYIFENLVVEPNPEGYKSWAARIGQDGFAAAYALTAGSPMHHVLKVLIDTTEFYYHYRDYPKEILALEESVGVYFKKVFSVVSHISAEVVMVGANFDDTITYPPFFRDHILPWLQEAADVLHDSGKLMLCHTDGENAGLLDYLYECGMDVADSVCPAPMTKISIAEYYQRWRNKITIIGGVPSNILLPRSASDTEFESYVDYLFKAVAPGNRFVIGVADAVPPDCKFDRLLRLSDRIQKETKLPLTTYDKMDLRSLHIVSKPLEGSDAAVNVDNNFVLIRKHLFEGLHLETAEQARELLKKRFSAQIILKKGLLAEMEIIGNKFRDGLVFVPEVLCAARAMNEALKVLEPHMVEGENNSCGRFVIGTVKGDLHDIGKNIVVCMLKGVGFEIIDLGINVSKEKFVDAVKEYKPDILGMSALLTTTMPEMQNVIEELKNAGLRNGIKVIVGGAPINDQFAKEIGADGYARDAGHGVQVAKQLLGLQ